MENLTAGDIWRRYEELDKARAALARLGATPEARLAKAKTDREREFGAAVTPDVLLIGTGT